VTWQRIRGGW